MNTLPKPLRGWGEDKIRIASKPSGFTTERVDDDVGPWFEENPPYFLDACRHFFGCRSWRNRHANR
jgi:hypothetical protein